jgi:PAS domain S-box-containing protein
MTKETKTQATFERSAAIFMAFVCAISLLAGAGWLFNRTILASLRSEYIPMAPANVLIFLGLCGVWLIHTYFSAQRGIRILIQVTLLGKLIVVIILALRYFTGLGPDLEKLLYPAPPLFGQFTTARMSPLSALGFLLAIPAFLFLTGSKPGPRTNRASAALALALFILSSLIVIGYLYGTPPFYGGTLTPVAITSAFSFLFLSLGLLLMAGPDRWPVRMYVGPSLRARLMRAFIPASVFIALFQGLFSTANDPWIVNPAIKVVVAALVACLIVLLLVFLIANNLSSDIERGRMAEEALTRSEAKLHALFAGMTDVVIVYDTDGRYIEIAPTNPANFTHSPEEMLGKTIHEILPKEPADAILAMIRTSIQSGQVANCEYDLQIDGKEIYFAASASRLSETTAIMVAHDITNRKRAEQLLREIEERYRTLIEASTDMIFVIDRADRVQYINTFSARQFGMTPEQVIGKPRTDLFPPDIADQQGQSLRSVFASGQPVANDARLRFGEREVWISSSLVPLRDESGAVIAVMGISRDITEHKQVEQALKRAERKYRYIFVNAMEGIHQTTYDGKIISVNLAGARILGFDSPEELMTSANFLNTRFYVQPGRREEFQRLIETKEALSGFESEIYRKDGSTAWISENAHAVRDEHGNLLYNEGTSVDITERKRAEEALATSEAKLHALFAGMTDVVIIYDIDGRYLEIAPTNPANLYRPPEESSRKSRPTPSSP